MMEWDKIGLLALSLLTLGWTVYSTNRKAKDEQSVAQITDRASFMKDMQTALDKAEAANERLEKLLQDANRTIIKLERSVNKAEHESEIWKNKAEIQEAALKSFREDVERLESFEEEVYDLRRSNQEMIRLYETALLEKDKKFNELEERSQRQGTAIQTMKKILSDNGLTANLEL